MIYYIYDELGMIRQVKSKTEAQYLVSLRPDWKIVAKKVLAAEIAGVTYESHNAASAARDSQQHGQGAQQIRPKGRPVRHPADG